MSFAIEQGAHFEGRSRRARGEADLLAVAEGRASPNLQMFEQIIAVARVSSYVVYLAQAPAPHPRCG